MKRVFFVKLRSDQAVYSFVRYEVVAQTAEQAIRKAKTQAKRDTGERHSVDELLNRGEAL